MEMQLTNLNFSVNVLTFGSGKTDELTRGMHVRSVNDCWRDLC